jgi:hypothetical protein
VGTTQCGEAVRAFVGNDLLRLQSSSGALMVGTGGLSYTLNRRERAEQPGDPATAADFSYTISPRATGSTLFGLFEGRTPCRNIAQDLKLGEVPGCIKVNGRVTLYQDPQTAAPARYKIESTLHRQQPRVGTWRMAKGAPGQPAAVVYELAAAGREAPILLMRGDDNVLFFLNQQRQMLVGSIDFGYTLNRVTETPRASPKIARINRAKAGPASPKLVRVNRAKAGPASPKLVRVNRAKAG